MTAFVQKLTAQWVLDSAGIPGMEATLQVSGHTFSASAPGSIFFSPLEILPPRDSNSQSRGKGIHHSLDALSSFLAPALEGNALPDQMEMDLTLAEMGEQHPSLGKLTLLSVSMAACRANAFFQGIPLHHYISSLLPGARMQVPIPVASVIGGGVHAPFPARSVSLLPPNARSLPDALETHAAFREILFREIKSTYGRTSLGTSPEGGFRLNHPSLEEGLSMLERVADAHFPGQENAFLLHAAAHHFYHEPGYRLDTETLDTNQLLSHYQTLLRRYSVAGIIDPFHESEWPAHKELMEKSGGETLLAPSRLVSGNPLRAQKAAQMKVGNMLYLEFGQSPTLLDALHCVSEARKNGWEIAIAPSPGNTEDVFAADFAVGVGATLFAGGGTVHAEHTAQYNRLLHIARNAPNPLSYARLKARSAKP